MSNGKTICTLCNYIYDEALGDTKRNIGKSVPFEALAADWCCPECGADKTMFQPCSCVTLSSLDELEEKTVGELVAQHPQYARVFESFAIDYCCGGKLKIKEACDKKNVDLKLVLESLRSSRADQGSAAEPNWNDSTLKELVDHIVKTYHFPLREELPRIEQLAKKVAHVHGERHPEMVQLFEIFSDFKMQLELHMQKEEIILFPAIVQSEKSLERSVFGCGGGIENPINVMLQEHDDAGDALKQMRSLANDYVAPDDACNTFRVLLDSLKNLEKEMHDHVHKENHILFPRALALPKPKLAAC